MLKVAIRSGGLLLVVMPGLVFLGCRCPKFDPTSIRVQFQEPRTHTLVLRNGTNGEIALLEHDTETVVKRLAPGGETQMPLVRAFTVYGLVETSREWYKSGEGYLKLDVPDEGRLIQHSGADAVLLILFPGAAEPNQVRIELGECLADDSCPQNEHELVIDGPPMSDSIPVRTICPCSE